MSAIKYKSKINVPGVELSDQVILTAPGGRFSTGKNTTVDHTRDNDAITFGHLVNCKIELWEDDQIIGTGGGESTAEKWVITETRKPMSVTDASSNLPYLRFLITESEYKSQISFNSITMSGTSTGIMRNQRLKSANNQYILEIQAGFVNASNEPSDYSAAITFDKTNLL